MKIFKSNELKNVTLLGSMSSGKTSLAESFLFNGGQISRLGTPENRTCVSDYHPVEREYGNSVFSTVMHTLWSGIKINFIDTPGSNDFCGGRISSMNIMDTGILLINAKHGVEVSTELITRRASKKGLPLVFVINKLDSEKADFQDSLDSCISHFGNKVTVIQYPIETGTKFNSIVDILKMKLYRWKDEGGKPEILEIPKNEKSRAIEFRNELIEAVAENNEVLFNTYISEGKLSEQHITDGLKQGIIDRDIFPLLCISATKNIGVQRLMEFITKMLPSVNDVETLPSISGRKAICKSELASSLFVFKTSIEPHIGEMIYFKLVSGVLTEGDELQNINTDSKEKISQLFIVSGKNRERVKQLHAGDIGATVKLKHTKNNHTLNNKTSDYIYKDIIYPNPKYRIAIKTINEEDEERLNEALQKMHEEDPTLIYAYSKELKQLILYGQGEFHIKTAKWRLEHNDNILIKFEEPKIEYRETISTISNSSYKHKKQSGGSGQFAEIHMIIEPYYEDMPRPKKYIIDNKEIKVNLKNTEEIDLDWGGKLVICNCIVGGVIDTRYMPAIHKGIMEKMESGPLTGSYARDVRVIIYDGKMHQVDSNEISFKLASRYAFDEAFKIANPIIMEPIYNLEILTNEENIGDIMIDLQSRRASINSIDTDKSFQLIKACIPLKETNGYSTRLSSLSGGRANFSMEFCEYKKMPLEVQKKLMRECRTEELVY